MTFYDLGLSFDALNVSVLDEIVSFISALIFLIFTFYLIFNLGDFNPESKSRLERFLSISKILTTSILVISAVAFLAFTVNTIYLLAKTSPNTIVERRYVLDHSTRTIDVKDDFKTVYTNDQDVSFSSQIDNDFYEKLPEDLKNEIKNHVHFSFSEFKSSYDKDVVLFSTDRDSTSTQIDVLKAFSKHKQVIKIDADKDGTYVPILATIDSIELTKEEENEENLTYHIDKIEMANAVETISRDSQSKSRDIKSIRLHISGKTSKAAKAKKSIEKLVE